MAQNITLLGASYSAVPAVVLPKTGGGTARVDDASVTTATASDVASGKIFLANDGTITTGTSSGGGGTTTPYYMWRDSSGYVHFSATDHSGYQINVSSVEEHYNWTTIYNGTISDWEQLKHCYEYFLNESIGLVPGDTYRVTYDGTPYIIECPSDRKLLGSDVYSWDGTSPLDYPFGIENADGSTYFDVTTGGAHTFLIEHRG